MTVVSADEITKARSIPLIDFINASNIDVVSEGNGKEPAYRLKDHDSLVITGNKFYWNSRSEGGYGAIDFAIKYKGMKFTEAVKHVNDFEYGTLTEIKEQGTEQKEFKYPTYFETKDTQAIRDYLVGERKIDKRVIDWCIQKDLLVQDKRNNAVFKWKDNKGKVIGGDRQGTEKIDTKRGTFKQIIPNSKSTGAFTIDVGKRPNKIAFFESPIDMLSYWSIQKGQVKDTRMISMGGLKMESLVKSMKDVIEKGKEIDSNFKFEKLISAVDNDEAGNLFHEKLEKIFKKEFIIDHRPKNSKDWNEELKKNQIALQKNTIKNQQLGM